MAILPHQRDADQLIRDIRAEMAQNRTDIERLWKWLKRIEATAAPITHPPSPAP